MLSSYFSVVMLGAAVKRARTRASDVVVAIEWPPSHGVLPTKPSFCGPNEGSESGELHHTSPKLDPVLIPLSASPAVAVHPKRLVDRWAVSTSAPAAPAVGVAAENRAISAHCARTRGTC